VKHLDHDGKEAVNALAEHFALSKADTL